MESDSEFVEHKPCPCGVSSDALAVYTDGHSYCFRCSTTFNGKEKVTVPSQLIDDINIVALDKRKISEETCRKFGYGTGNYFGKFVQVAPYYKDNKLVAQKIRDASKKFSSVGNLREAELFGQHLWKAGGKRIIVTEGEIDCLSVAEAFKGWPVVSVKNGAAGAVKCIKQQIEYLETFDQVIFMFDEDEVGKKSAKQCAEVISPSKAYIASLPRKDANEMLVAGEVQELVKCIFNASESRPDGIVNGYDTWEEVNKPIEMGTLYPFNDLNKKTYGLRRGELVTITAGSGVGKSAFVSELAYHLAFHHDDNVGYIALEENIGRTARRFMGINLNKPIHLPNQEVSEDELRNAFQNTMGKQKIWLYDHWGSLDSDNLLSKMRYLVKACDCKWLILDHLSIVISGMELDGDERRMLDKCMTMLRSFAEETQCGLLIVSHLRRPMGGKSHEEGLMPSLSDLRSSHSIAQLSDMVLALGRNSQSDNDDERNTTEVRILKNRFSGETGQGCALRYSTHTGRLEEADYSFTEF